MSESDRSDAQPDKPAAIGEGDGNGGTAAPKGRREDAAKPDGEVIGELGDAVGGPA